MYAKKAESEAKVQKRAAGPGPPAPIGGRVTGATSIYNAKKAEELTSACHWTSAATAVVSTSATAEQEQYDDDPAWIIAAAAAISTAIVSTETHQADDPENTATGIISEKTGSIAASTSTVIVATTAVISASTVCSS